MFAGPSNGMPEIGAAAGQAVQQGQQAAARAAAVAANAAHAAINEARRQ